MLNNIEWHEHFSFSYYLHNCYLIITIKIVQNMTSLVYIVCIKLLFGIRDYVNLISFIIPFLGSLFFYYMARGKKVDGLSVINVKINLKGVQLVKYSPRVLIRSKSDSNFMAAIEWNDRKIWLFNDYRKKNICKQVHVNQYLIFQIVAWTLS